MPCLTWNMILAAHPCWPWKGAVLEPECCAGQDGDNSRGTGSTGRLAASASHGASPFRECWGSPGRALQGSTGQCQTRSGWELMAKRVIPACLQLHLPPRASAAGKTQRSNAGRICSPGCRDFPPTGDHHLASSISRAGPRRAEWGPAPSGATVHMCHRLDTRGNRLETSGPAARASSSVDRGTGRYLVLLGLPSRLSGTQRGSGAHRQDSG